MQDELGRRTHQKQDPLIEPSDVDDVDRAVVQRRKEALEAPAHGDEGLLPAADPAVVDARPDQALAGEEGGDDVDPFYVQARDESRVW